MSFVYLVLTVIPACSWMGGAKRADRVTTIDVFATTHVGGATKPCT